MKIKIGLITVIISILLPKLVIANEVLPLNSNTNFSITETSPVSLIKKPLFGTLEIRAVDDFKHEKLQYVIYTLDKTMYFLDFIKNPKQRLLTGMKIKINPNFILKTIKGAQHLQVNPDKLMILANKMPRIKVNDAFGPQNTVVLLVNFQNDPKNYPWTIEDVNKIVFKNVNSIYDDYSYHQTSIIGKTFGIYTIALNSTDSCDTLLAKLPGLAESAATQAGVSLDGYMRRIYVFPEVKDCHWGGLGTLGRSKSYSEAFIHQSINDYVFAHEMGHNLALLHSHSLICPNGTANQGDCKVDEYGDILDTMGKYTGHFNSYQKEHLGWLDNTTAAITTVTMSNQYTIEPFETATQGPKTLKILKSKLSDGSKEYYYVEFRQPIGKDVNDNNAYCTGCDYFKGVLIHQGNNSDIGLVNLLDMSPTDNNSNTVALLPGNTFTDTTAENGGITITLNQLASNSAKITVTIGNSPICVRKPPTVYYSPNTTQSVKPLGKASVAVKIVNNDSISCPDSTFVLDAVLFPNPMQVNVTPHSLTAKANGGVANYNIEMILNGKATIGSSYSARFRMGDTLTNRPQWFDAWVKVSN